MEFQFFTYDEIDKLSITQIKEEMSRLLKISIDQKIASNMEALLYAKNRFEKNENNEFDDLQVVRPYVKFLTEVVAVELYERRKSSASFN